MVIAIDKGIEEPVYRQIRSQIIAAIAEGELAVGQALPSVRRLASDLGINFHTVNKAYAVLRDEGYLVLRGRSGAYVAKPAPADGSAVSEQLADEARSLAIAFKAKGATAEQFLSCVEREVCEVFGVSYADLSSAASVVNTGLAENAGSGARVDPAAQGGSPDLGPSSRKGDRKQAKKRDKAASRQTEFVQLSLLAD